MLQVPDGRDVDLRVRAAEFRENLAARAAGVRHLFPAGDDGDGFELFLPRGDCGEYRVAFSADGQTVRRIFHVAAGEYTSVGGQQGRPDMELGVGRMTPMFIQEPFWELTNSLKDAYYISVNSEYQFLPEFIEDKGIAILGDIGTVLKDLRKAKEESAFVC